jgi:protein phosphatase
VVLVVAAIVWGVIASYQWTQTKYFVGADDGVVVIYQGVQQNVGPFSLSSAFEETDIVVDELPLFIQDSVQDTLPADSLDEARDIVERLTRD